MSPVMSPPARSPNQRTLAAIVFTDVVSFSSRMQADELGTLRMLHRDFAEMRRICTEHEGAVLKTTGDGLLLTFTSAVQAVACALAMQRQFAAEAKNVAIGGALQHRIGIHLGDVLVHDQDVMGDGVNIASRLQAEAEPGGICISQTVYDVVKNKLEMNVVSLGARELKNISHAMPVYQLLLEAQALDATGKPRGISAKRGRSRSRTLLLAGGGVALLAAIVVVMNSRGRAPSKLLVEGPAVAVMPAVLSSASATPVSASSAPVAPPAARATAREKVDLADELSSEIAQRREVMQQLHAQYLDRYDFTGLVLALREKAESPSAAPGLKKMLRGAEELATLKDWLDFTLRRYTPEHPLPVRELTGKQVARELGAYLTADGRVVFITPGSPQPHEWAQLQPEVMGALVVSALRDGRRPGRNITQAAHIFARFYALPAMTEALGRSGR